jgi:hypothetical protein
LGPLGARNTLNKLKGGGPKFDAKWEADLAARAAGEAAQLLERRASAQADIAGFHQARARQRDAAQDKNRMLEQALAEKLEADRTGANPWARVVALVDIDPKAKDDVASDVARMRQLLIQLKNEPPQ